MKRIDMYVRPNRPDLDATKTPTLIDIAWSAGIYEGEGNIRLCGRGKRGLAASVAQKDPEILYRMRDWFGGSIGNPSGGNCCYKFDICGDRARVFIALAYPYLSKRRKMQVDATGAMEFMVGASPEGLSMEELKDRLVGFYKSHGKYVHEGTPEERKRQQGRDYMRQKRAADKQAKIVSIA
jgi:hypothetical protein